ncbi:MAG TPA: hypothetical protein VGI95_08950 [Caulobacteraceae bacterium]|jgi:hypothetical protein
MTPATIASLIDRDEMSALRVDPGFREAVERATAESVAHFQSLPPTYQWITKDIGRAAICFIAVTMDLVGGLTVQALTAACIRNEVSSAGRVHQVVRRCQEAGVLTIDDGPGIWTRRRARLGDDLIRLFRERSLIDLRAMLPLAPELAGAAELAETDEGFASYILSLSSILTLRRDLFGSEDGSPLVHFLEREAGMLILFDLLGRQASTRDDLLEEAPISRYDLSRRYGVSRAHINKLLAESGHTEGAGKDRIVFAPTLSEALDSHFAAIFRLNRAAGQVLLSGWRPRSARQ